MYCQLNAIYCLNQCYSEMQRTEMNLTSQQTLTKMIVSKTNTSCSWLDFQIINLAVVKVIVIRTN